MVYYYTILKGFDLCRVSWYVYTTCARGCSSAGRASGLQPEGQRFNSAHLHRLTEVISLLRIRRRSLTTV